LNQSMVEWPLSGPPSEWFPTGPLAFNMADVAKK